MIINYLISFILGIISIFFVFLPVVTLADIPVIGDTISSLLLTMVRMWNSFIDTFPYAGTAWQVFLYVILPFELLMLVGKFFLGHRMPDKQI